MHYLGIDAGSLYLKFWLENEMGEVLLAQSVHHRGRPQETALGMLSRMHPKPDCVYASGLGMDHGSITSITDGLLAEVAFMRDAYPQRTMLVFGAEKIEFVRFDDDGGILEYRTNTSCAAGTGSFLDEQMVRLGLDPEALETIPLIENAPLVATRCAVFAKTDLVHLQQEGYSAHAMYNGLCRGLAASSLKSVFGASLPEGEGMIATGGLAANPHFRHFLLSLCPGLSIADTPAFTRARGVCAQARAASSSQKRPTAFTGWRPRSQAAQKAGSPLKLVKSAFPQESMARAVDRHGNEIWHRLQAGRLRCSLGIDIGSTSTKAVLVDPGGEIVLDVYTKTAGNPLDATRRIFAGIVEAARATGCTLEVTSCGTTGSGRRLVGVVTGADLIVNEISAHAKGALTLDPSARTIFEIGGQDAKFIRLEAGTVVDVNMNYVCAAGTGSFVEEQARTLGIGLDEIGRLVMGVAPLPNSDRCTVFMNREISRQLSQGLPRERILAGVLVAVLKNYLTKVVGTRRYARDRIVFQGATARNIGLVAAIEQLTGASILVSPFCHVMGAFGAALLASEKVGSQTRFLGFSIPEVSVTESTCRGCENSCRITHLDMDGEKTSWGYLCGREPGVRSRGRRVNRCIKERNDTVSAYASRYTPGPKGTVKMPALGLNDEFTPLFGEIMQASGYGLELVRVERARILGELSRLGTGDFCWPVKVSMASAMAVLSGDPSCRVLLPHLVQGRKDPSIHPRSLYCPFMTALPSFLRSRPGHDRIIPLVIDLGRPMGELARLVARTLEEAGLGRVPAPRLEGAMELGLALTDRMRGEVSSAARRLLEEAGPDEKVIVVIGRPYNLYHQVLNLGIPELVESLGYRVVTLDAVPDLVTDKEVCRSFPDMYWAQGLKILRKAASIVSMPNVFPLVISNFSCGPDSFLLTYLEELFRDKPYLILELDEHGSATGYQTRIEAFLDMIEQHRRTSTPRAGMLAGRRIRYSLKDIPEGTTVWIPQIHPYTPQLWAAVLGRKGIDARPLGEETADDCSLGRELCRGSECLPAAVTTGRYAAEVRRRERAGSTCLFMPRAEGPCRFGQYATLQSLVMERTGMEGSFVFSPTSENGYAFLDRSTELAVWEALCLGDALYKLRCRVVPYHDRPDAAQGLIASAIDEICTAMRKGGDWRGIARALPAMLDAHRYLSRPRRPLVGIVGEIFVRLNLFSNQHVVETVERYGGEAWLAPMSEWVHYVWRLLRVKSPLLSKLRPMIKSYILHRVEQDVMALFRGVLDDRHEPPIGEVLARGSRLVPLAFEGEAILTLGRAQIFGEQGASLVVNCSPFGCMPGRITAYLFQSMQGFFKAPVVNLFFDGTGDVAEEVGVYLTSLARGDERRSSVSSVFKLPGRTSPLGVVEDEHQARTHRPWS